VNDELGAQWRRQAKLRPEAADLYPNIPPDVWLPAESVAERLWVLWIERGEASRALGRVLNSEHFEFRSGEPPSGEMHLRRRRTDQS
jgi:hypothetical protein